MLFSCEKIYGNKSIYYFFKFNIRKKVERMNYITISLKIIMKIRILIRDKEPFSLLGLEGGINGDSGRRMLEIFKRIKIQVHF